MLDDLLLTALHSSAFAITTDAVVAVDGKQDIVLFSAGAEATFGYDAASMIGQPLSRLIPERFREEHGKRIAQFAESRETLRPMTQRQEILSLHRDGHEFRSQAAIARVEVDGKVVLTAVVRDVTVQLRQEERVQTVLKELDHRVRNVLTRLSAVVQLTSTSATSTAEYREALLSRLDSISRAHAQLARTDWLGVEMKDLILDQIRPYADDRNFQLDGPSLGLSAEAAQSLSMIIHELATNAVKHGALSTVPSGLVKISWRLSEAPDRRLLLSWREPGGISPTKQTTAGLGTTLIRQLVTHELNGHANLSFSPGGAVCELSL
ncbi:MAG: HWE histidine kinase domain-containing protein, partial [Hyphomicrobium sp.]